LKTNLEIGKLKVGTKISKAQEQQKKQYDRFAKGISSYVVGDLVRLVNERNTVGESKSFKTRALGLFRILEAFNSVNYKVVDLASGKAQLVHFNRLHPYRSTS
jgi:hypothetical protein